MSAPLPSAVLFVSGSRALCDTPDATAWARAILSDAVFALPRRSVVIAGDASGPDAWALGMAACRPGIARRTYALDGLVHCEPSGRRWSWSPRPREATSYTSRQWPLVRNTFAVADTANLARDGVPVYVLALHAPWSRTAGTLHTARLAQRERLWTDVRTAPAARGPQGARS